MTIAVFTERVRQGGHGLVVGLSGAGIERATGWRPAQPLNGQRCLTRAAFEAARPLAAGFGVETALTIDLLRAGMRVTEVEVPLAHRATGNDWASQLHRARQLADVARALAAREPATRGLTVRPGQACARAGSVPGASDIRAAGRPGHAPVARPMPPVARHRAELTGQAGLAASLASVVLTFGVAAAGPSAMEPALPGGAGQPPWSLGLHLPAGLAIGLAAAALAVGATGLGLCLHAARHGWAVSPRLLLGAGLIAAAALTLVPPFGSADHLSYAAYGRMAVTGHDPYTTTPAMLARLGDPVARAVQDWRHSPSVYGSVATGLQALAARDRRPVRARCTVFVLSLLNLAAFAGTGLLAHRLARGHRDRQMRAALLWTANPLLLQVLVAGAHVDGLAVFLAVAALALFCSFAALRPPCHPGPCRTPAPGARSWPMAPTPTKECGRCRNRPHPRSAAPSRLSSSPPVPGPSRGSRSRSRFPWCWCSPG